MKSRILTYKDQINSNEKRKSKKMENQGNNKRMKIDEEKSKENENSTSTEIENLDRNKVSKFPDKEFEDLFNMLKSFDK
ncbi:hypothetical protein BLA29_003977 [Euroglyphus maynei]|uniref:Uncharacterized protein n=1 Tax=Euroglyphus maynei TaxID=6958 RepID=A0A1Y3BFI9_EURMA|nr:hypothetical protein BLA29_003977 [Euroglyphus maynei]